MARPREHDLDALLDHARRIWVRDGMTGVTVRALSAESGVPNGSLYNAFGSRATLLARVWVRQADVFLAFQRDVADLALADRSPADAVVAVALAPATYAETDEEGARLLLGAQADELAGDDVAAAQLADLARLRRELTALITELADRLWGRTDSAALALVRICVVDLPGRLLLSRHRPTDHLARHALAAAVRGIVTTPAPPAPAPPITAPPTEGVTTCPS